MEKAHAIRNELFAVQQAIMTSPKGSRRRATLEAREQAIERRLMVSHVPLLQRCGFRNFCAAASKEP